MEHSISRTDGVTTLRIAGELDAVTIPDLRPAVVALLNERPARIVVDVSRLRLIDSCGVGGLVFLYKEAKKYGGVVTVRGLCDQPAAIFKLLRLDRVLQEEGLADFPRILKEASVKAMQSPRASME